MCYKFNQNNKGQMHLPDVSLLAQKINIKQNPLLLYSAGNKLNASRNTPSRFIPYLYCVYVGRLHTLPMLVPGFVNPVSLLRTCPTPLWGTAGTVRACRRGPADCYRRGGNTVWVCGCVGGTINCILTKVAIF